MSTAGSSTSDPDETSREARPEPGGEDESVHAGDRPAEEETGERRRGSAWALRQHLPGTVSGRIWAGVAVLALIFLVGAPVEPLDQHRPYLTPYAALLVYAAGAFLGLVGAFRLCGTIVRGLNAGVAGIVVAVFWFLGALAFVGFVTLAVFWSMPDLHGDLVGCGWPKTDEVCYVVDVYGPIMIPNGEEPPPFIW